MLSINERFAELNKNGIESTLRLTAITIEGAEQLAKLQLDFARRSLEENAKSTAASDTSNWQGGLAARTMKLAETSFETTLDYARNVFETMSRTQGELLKLMEDSLVFGKESLQQFEEEMRTSPEGSFDFASAAIKSTMATTAAAVEGMTQAARQFTEYASKTAGPVETPAPPPPKAETSTRRAAAHHH